MNWRKKSKNDWGRLDLILNKEIKYSKIIDSLYIKGRIGWKGLKKEEYLPNSDFRIINGKSVKEGGIDWGETGYITKERYDESPEIMLKSSDIVITKDGTIGKVALIDELTKPTTVASGLFVLRNINPEKWDTKFLYYYLISPFFKSFIESRTEGSVIPHLYQRDFEQLELPEFSLKEQRAVSNLLSDLDNRIAENKKINHHLAEILQVNLTQQLNEFHEKYRIGDLDLTVSDHVANGSFKSLKENVELVEKPDYALFLRNVDLKNKLNGDRRYVTESSYKFLKKSRLYGHEVIISNVADVGSVHRVPKMNMPMVAGNNVVFLQADNGLLTDYLYVYFNSRLGQHDIESITSGSAQQKFNKTDFRNLEIPILNDEIIHTQITPLLRYMDNINGEISRLIELRDSLLPKLMSGEISVTV